MGVNGGRSVVAHLGATRGRCAPGSGPAALPTSIGVKDQMSESIERVVAKAKVDGVQLVRFLYCDPCGVIRGNNVHVDRLASRMREGVGLTRARHGTTWPSRSFAR